MNEATNLLPVIAIDGPSAAGKSTVARKVAEALQIRSFDTGLLYRTAALLALKSGTSPSDVSALTGLIDEASIELDPSGRLLVNGENVSALLRTPEIEAVVSEISAHPDVRARLFQAQRRIAEAAPVVMVGRDITTVVAPDAAVRVYLDASAEERARRRHDERIVNDPSASFEEILADVRGRDHKDSSRETAPLRAAEGVAVINTDGRSVDQVTAQILALARLKMPAAFAQRTSLRNEIPDTPPAKYLEGSGKYSWKRQTAQLLNGWWIDLLTNLEVEGEENIPPWGPLLYVSNHLHNLDPAIEYKAFPRPLHFMGKQELFKFPVIKQIAEASGGFPVDRGKVDREALRNAEDRIERGIPLGIYPEGGRSPNGALIEGKSGAGMLALKSGAPVLPVALTGSERLPLNGGKGKSQRQVKDLRSGERKVRLVYGAPFTVPRRFEGEKIGSDEATEIIMLEIARLLPEEYRGVYADRLREQKVRKIVPYSFADWVTASSSDASSES